ncbi:hypothetical protein H8356DRAFT_1673988, partial [Neocallimastix lanati (nom. inval.)]
MNRSSLLFGSRKNSFQKTLITIFTPFITNILISQPSFNFLGLLEFLIYPYIYNFYFI